MYQIQPILEQKNIFEKQKIYIFFFKYKIEDKILFFEKKNDQILMLFEKLI